MNAPGAEKFRLEESELQASALRAQVLERGRRTLNHDLNNAVQSIHSGLELLSKCVSSGTLARVTPQECIALVKQQVVTLQNAFHEMLTLAAESPGAPEAFDLSPLVSDALKILRHERGVGKARLQIESGVRAHARKVNVRTLALALILEACDRAQLNDVLTISVSHFEGRASLMVSRQISALGQTDESLALAKLFNSVASAEGGELRIQESGGERTLQLLLPAAAQIEAVPSSANAQIPTQGPLRLLIADRNKDTADSLAMILQLEGHDAKTTYSGADLVDVARTFSPHIVLLDVDLPDCDVHEVVGALRDPHQTRVLVQVSGAGRNRDPAFDVHLTRPVEWPQLQMLLSSVRLRDRS
jgi:CheY-like chemotaxis protein